MFITLCAARINLAGQPGYQLCRDGDILMLRPGDIVRIESCNVYRDGHWPRDGARVVYRDGDSQRWQAVRETPAEIAKMLPAFPAEAA